MMADRDAVLAGPEGGELAGGGLDGVGGAEELGLGEDGGVGRVLPGLPLERLRQRHQLRHGCRDRSPGRCQGLPPFLPGPLQEAQQTQQQLAHLKAPAYLR